MQYRTTRRVWAGPQAALALAAGSIMLAAWPAGAQQAGAPFTPPPHYTIPGPDETCVLYATGEEVLIPTEQVWKFICNSDTAGLTADDLKRIAEEHAAKLDLGFEKFDSTHSRAFNIVFNLTADVPAAAKPAIAKAEAYLEGLFSDPITVTITLDFANMGSGVLGATGSSYTNQTWPNTRDGLKNGADSDDTVQAYVPPGTTIPVRYNGLSATVTSETRVFVTKANTKATIGSTTGTDCSMTYNTDFAWDYDPADGIPSGRYSFIDVLVHETGHGLGFVSGVDFRTADIEMLDVFRFERTDEDGTENPDTLEQFKTIARVADLGTPTDDHNFDDLGTEYRFSDGTPWQASHWREQASSIGCMDPALAARETNYPDYYIASDIHAFDAIGYDRSSCSTTITDQPDSTTACEGDNVTFTVAATGTSLSYAWRKDGTPISGATSPSYTLVGVDFADTGTYDCVVTSSCGSITSNGATLTINSDASIYDQPDSITRAPGETATFFVGALGSPDPVYQWRKNGTPIDGATATSYSIASVTAGDAGDYDVYVINECATVLSATAHLTVSGGGTCKPDCNKDGKLNINDFICMKSAFDAKSAYGDYNGDAKWDIKDWIAFQSDFVKGCP